MIKKLLLKKIPLRGVISCILTSIAYFLSIIYLFGFHDILGSITCVLATFVCFHFLFIDIKNINIWYVCLILIVMILVEVGAFYLLDWEINLWIILSLVGFNAAIGALFYSLGMTSFNSIGYFTRGGYMFTLCIAIMYSIAFVGMFQQFPFTCQGLNDASNKMFQFVEKPFVMLKKEKVENENDLGKNISKLIQEINDTDVSEKGKLSHENLLVKRFNDFKTKTIDQILADKSEYSDGVCDLLLDEINTILNNNGVKISVIILSYFLLYGFIRIAVFVMSGLGFLIFKILYWCKVYRITEKTRKVDEIV